MIIQILLNNKYVLVLFYLCICAAKRIQVNNGPTSRNPSEDQDCIREKYRAAAKKPTSIFDQTLMCVIIIIFAIIAAFFRH